MNYHSKKKITSTESVELVDLVERELPSTSFFQMMPSSSEKFKIITTLKSKKCHKTLKILIQLERTEIKQTHLIKIIMHNDELKIKYQILVIM